MQKTDSKQDFYRQRNAGASITDGYRFFFQNFTTFIRRTWLWCVLYALTIGYIGYYFFMHLFPLMYSGNETYLTEMLIFIGLVALYMFIAIIICNIIFSIMLEYRENGVASSGKWYCPFSIKTMPRMFKALWKCIKKFWRYLAVAVVVAIITIILSILLEGSALYLSIAHVKAQESIAVGDVSQMPANIGIITFLVFTFCGLLQALIHSSSLFPFYYAYGSTNHK